MAIRSEPGLEMEICGYQDIAGTWNQKLKI